MDFKRHNEEAAAVWEAYRAGKPARVPMVLTSVPRIWVLDPALNTRGITWKMYLDDPRILYEVALAHRYHVAHHIPQDAEMGVPAARWEVPIEFGNVYEEAWFGCEVVYPEGQIAVTRPAYAGDAKNAVFERGMPGPFDGFMGKIRETYEFFQDKARSGEFHGRPIHVLPPVSLGTDGPLTVANGLRGPQIFEDMLKDEDYYHRLMSFITEATIARILAWRSHLGLEMRPERGGFADDAVQFLSLKAYTEKVLPYHRRLMSALYGPGPHGVHLCGNAQRFFPTLVRELNVRSFDTGFPIDFRSLREQVGEEVEIQGGVPAADLVTGSPRQVYEQARAILLSGAARGGRFIFKEANDLAPRTPPENMQAMYQAAREFGSQALA